MEFDDYCWHDNHIHGFRVVQKSHGQGDLELDIDYISEWICQEDNSCLFKISPATLTFLGVTDLEIMLNYKVGKEAVMPALIGEIKRSTYVYPNGHESYAWDIVLNRPDRSYMRFKAIGFSQVSRKEPFIYDSQSLPPSMRT